MQQHKCSINHAPRSKICCWLATLSLSRFGVFWFILFMRCIMSSVPAVRSSSSAFPIGEWQFNRHTRISTELLMRYLLDRRCYPTEVIIGKVPMVKIQLIPDSFHGERSYTIRSM